jgi:serine protease Do
MEVDEMEEVLFGDVAEKLRRSTVLVRTASLGSGSGVIWGDSVSVVTNAHVVREEQATVEVWDGRTLEATVAKSDAARDLALLRIPDAVTVPPVIRPSRRCRPGELVMAIGNPLGFIGALSTGVIRQVAPVRGLGKRDWIQATVRLAPGNSGGPLADAEGSILGINAMAAAGLALAIPSEEVLAFLARSSPAWLGVTARDVRFPQGNRSREGVLILKTERESPAERASLLPGDILTEIDGLPIRNCEDLASALSIEGTSVLRFGFVRADAMRRRVVTVQVGPPRAAAA